VFQIYLGNAKICLLNKVSQDSTNGFLVLNIYLEQYGFRFIKMPSQVKSLFRFIKVPSLVYTKQLKCVFRFMPSLVYRSAFSGLGLVWRF